MNQQIRKLISTCAVSIVPFIGPIGPNLAPIPQSVKPLSTHVQVQEEWSEYLQRGEDAYIHNDIASAEKYYKAALKAARGNYDRQLESLDHLYWLYDESDRVEDITKILQQTITVLQHTSPHGSRIAHSYAQLASLATFLGHDVQEARHDWFESAKAFEAAHDTDSSSYGSVLNNLGALEALSKQYPQAESHYKSALKILERNGETARFEAVVTAQNLAELYIRWHKPLMAVPVYKKALHMLVALVGPDDPMVTALKLRYKRLGGK
jgi:tetratricopeptide (TPR) repeat protein